MSIGAKIKVLEMFRFVPDCVKTKKISKSVVKKLVFVITHVLAH